MKDIIQRKLDSYKARTEQDEENALKEITQEVCLYSLAKSGFFEKAAFQGGTCLRIVYGLDRFSEDLDFALMKPDKNFELAPYLKKTSDLMEAYGYGMEVAGKESADDSVKTRFLKDDSIKKIVTFKHLSDVRKKINIKVELDSNPPLFATDEPKFLDFPTDYSIRCHDPGSLFAGKIHALLCRNFIKGRDWYDFNWYIAERTAPNYELLKAALSQQGPWKNQELSINREWLVSALTDKIQTIPWKQTIEDVSKFLRPEKRQEVEGLWSVDFFLSKTKKLVNKS